MAAQVVQGLTQHEIALFQEIFREKREITNRTMLHEAKENAHAKGLAKGFSQGRAAGKVEGKAEGLAEGEAKGRMEIIALLESGKTLEEAKQILGLNGN